MDINQINLSEGDVLIVTVDEDLTQENLNYLRERFEELLSIPVIIVNSNIISDMSVVGNPYYNNPGISRTHHTNISFDELMNSTNDINPNNDRDLNQEEFENNPDKEDFNF